MRYQNIASAAIIAVGIVVLGFCLKGGIDNFVNKDRRVTVKGLSEREVEANKVTWPIVTKETGNDLQALYTTTNRKVAAVKRFLTDNGLKNSEITVNAPTVADYLSQSSYSQDTKFRYTMSSSITVVSTNVSLVRSIIEKQGDLLEQGVAIIGGWETPVTYEYTDFQKMKPEMMAEAIQNAQKTAEQFAENSKSDLNKIVSADQGQFSIEDRDDNTPNIKKVRVVTTITYSLKD